MALSATSLLRETSVVYRKHLGNLLLISFIAAVVTTVLYFVFLPSSAQLIEIHQMLLANRSSTFVLANELTPEQRHVFIVIFLALLIGHTVLLSALLPFQQTLLKGSNDLSGKLFHLCPTLFIRVLVQNGLIVFIVQLCAMLFVIPGILMLILLAMAPVLLIQPEGGIVKSMSQSMSYCWKRFGLLAPIVLLVSLIQVIFMRFQFISLFSDLHFATLISAVFLNLINAFLITYLFRVFKQVVSNK